MRNGASEGSSLDVRRFFLGCTRVVRRRLRRGFKGTGRGFKLFAGEGRGIVVKLQTAKDGLKWYVCNISMERCMYTHIVHVGAPMKGCLKSVLSLEVRLYCRVAT